MKWRSGRKSRPVENWAGPLEEGTGPLERIGIWNSLDSRNIHKRK